MRSIRLQKMPLIDIMPTGLSLRKSAVTPEKYGMNRKSRIAPGDRREQALAGVLGVARSFSCATATGSGRASIGPEISAEGSRPSACSGD
jgi:hypothetical protein